MKSIKNKYSVGSLFSGVGGFELGFKKAGYQTLWAVENDQHASATYKLNFKNKLIQKDITKISKKEISSLDSVDVLTAGFPCQAFSIAGYQKGFEDPRGNLFLEILRFVRTLENKPKVLLLDEPAAGLGADDVTVLLKGLRKFVDEQNLCLVIIEHDLELVTSICPIIYVLHFGRIISEGSAEVITSDPTVIEAYLGKGYAPESNDGEGGSDAV